MLSEFLDQIRRQGRPEDYNIVLKDAFTGEGLSMDFRMVHEIRESGVVINRKGSWLTIPNHRIIEIREKGNVVWKKD